MRIVRFLIDIVVGSLAGVMALPLAWLTLQWAWKTSTGQPVDDGALVIGLLVGILFLCWRRPNLMLHTWLHETAHALMCVLLWVRVGAMSASAGQGGEIRHAPVGPIRTTAILIAPYVLPLLAGPVLAVRYFCDPSWLRLGLTGLCGFVLIIHLSDLWLNVRLNAFGRDADIPRVGHVLSVVLIVASLLLLAAAAVVVLHSQQPPAWWRGLFAP